MSWATNLLQQGGQAAGQLTKGFAGGFGEGSGIPQLAGKFTRAEGVTGKWADVGRMLGEMTGKQAPQLSTFSSLMELAKRPTQQTTTLPEKKKKKVSGDFIIPSESSYMAGE